MSGKLAQLPATMWLFRLRQLQCGVLVTYRDDTTISIFLFFLTSNGYFELLFLQRINFPDFLYIRSTIFLQHLNPMYLLSKQIVATV